jgi:hypothetical protein
VFHHADSTLVTPLSPVTIGETLTVSTTGLRTLDPSGNTSTGTAYIDGISARQSPAGEVYLVNLTVPSGVRSLDV